MGERGGLRRKGTGEGREKMSQRERAVRVLEHNSISNYKFIVVKCACKKMLIYRRYGMEWETQYHRVVLNNN